MPRASEIPPPHQHNSHRVPLRVKSTASSEANSLNRTTAGAERSSKLGDRRSPRTLLQEKKKGSRMVDLEAKLDQTMEELKKLKHQLSSAAAAETVAQKKLGKIEQVVQNPEQVYEEDEKNKPLSIEKDCESCITSDVEEIESKLLAETSNNIDIAILTANLAEKTKELETVEEEKKRLKLFAEEAIASSTIATKKTEDLQLKLSATEEELKQSKSLVEQLKINLEAEEVAKLSLESEMKCLRIQTDQWRKASEAAASILATGDQKPLESYNFSANGGLWSPLNTGLEVDEGVEGHKKKSGGGGIRVFGELWKKKGQNK